VRTNKIQITLLVLLFLLIGANNIFSQIITSSVIREDIEFWTELKDPVIIGYEDDPWGQINMPFNFVYDGTTISTIYVYGNGFLSLNKAYSPNGASLPRFPQDNMIISWYLRNLYTTGSLSYKVEGTAPFRVLTVQQLGARVVTDLSGKVFDVQIKFYETTNEVKIIFNRASGIGGAGVDGYLYFAGNYVGANARYINIKPNSPTVPSDFYYSTINPNITPFLTSATVKYFYSGRSFTLTSTPRLAGIYPDASTVLASGQLYTGSQHPHVRVSRGADQKDITIRYKITGPIGSSNSKTIYTAINAPNLGASERVNPNPQPIGTAIRVDMPHAKDLAGRLSDGALDLRNIDDFPSGEYNVEAILEYADGTPYSHSITSKFTIAFQSDLALIDVVEPVYTAGSIYQFSGPGVPVKILVRNQGAVPVTKFKANYKVYNSAGTMVGSYSEVFDILSNPLNFNEQREFSFAQFFKPSTIGVFNIVAEVNFDNPNQDKFLTNNIFPRIGDPKKLFEVGYSVEAQLLSVLSPTGIIYKGRPVRFSARLRNNGVSDISDTWASLKIIDPDGIVVKNDTIPVNEIPSGFIRTSDVFWQEPFIPLKTGNYRVELYIYAQDDEVPANNLLVSSVNVQAGLKGNYTISKSGGNFTTITAAVNALFERGVDGPVTFFLRDAEYYEGNILQNSPAIDLSSMIIGSGPTAPIKFTVDPLVATKGSVNIYLQSGAGIGIYFGQNYLPGNVNAPVLNVTPSLVKHYANTGGYITFDGGAKKSLRFTINTNSNFRSVFHIGSGAHNITIKNCIIEDGILQPPSYQCRIPGVVYNATANRFDYDNDLSSLGTYSAGIVVRNIPPRDRVLLTNPYNMDTIKIHKVEISNNEISKFGYGIVSLGLGSLFDVGKVSFLKYYNENNKFNNNDISGVSRAGIFLGYELNSEVVGNRIYNVNGVCGEDIAGIILGGDSRTNRFGYNNLSVQVSGNEISAVKGTNNLYGIKVEQSFYEFTNLDEKFFFPDVDENIRLVNNIVWGFEPEDPNANIIGLALFTERLNKNNWQAVEFKSKRASYYSKNDIISNNTIFLLNDGLNNTGVMIAAAIMNTQNATVVNNAIAIDDPNISSASPITSAFFYYGIHPNKGGIKTDRNAYWIQNTNASLFRFIEIDEIERILEVGYKLEFATLDQWQQWTKQDWNSVYGNFAKDYEKTGIAPFKYRVSSNPPPLGSILNNRGIALEVNKYDIDGQLRGEAGEKYDIGADEFKGRLYTKDLEVLVMPKPGNYKASAPQPFSDANYIMTTAPVGVNAIIRNNGLLVSSAVNATLKIFRQNPSGTFIQEGPTINGKIEDLLFSEEVLIDFKTDDNINLGDNYEFFPKTYGDLRGQGYTVPTEFFAMEANVTPLYKFVVEVPNDNNNANNKIEKIVRFYIRKSPIRLLVSAADISKDPITSLSPLNTIAGNLNLDSLRAVFKRLGWYINLELEDPRIDYDIFDRKKWEPRSIDYTIYRSLFWVDGDDKYLSGSLLLDNRLSRYDRDHLTAFLNAGSFAAKKNLVVGSQEIVRLESTDFPDWVRNTLFAKRKTPLSPLGTDIAYDNEYLKGIIIGREKQFLVKSTGFNGDAQPYPGTFLIDNPGVGFSRIGMTYKKYLGDDPNNNYFVPDAQRIASITTSFFRYNVILTGVDWRHIANLDDYIRGILDDLEYNQGYVIPVDLLSFEATPVGKRVELNWETASEINSSKFVIEKSIITENGRTNFEQIEEVPSVGNSNITTKYGPVVDMNVDYNNSYAYRLKMVDRNGEFKYSDEKIVTLNSYGKLSLSEVKPNPVSSTARIEVALEKSQNIELTIVDINGKTISTIFNGNANSGINNYEFNVSGLANGTYNIILNANGVILNTKLNVVR